MPARCAAAPSSVGAGILLQSTSSRFFSFMSSPSINRHCERSEAIHPSLQHNGLLRFARNDGQTFLSPRPHQAALFPAPIAFLFALALVVQLLALGDRQQELGAATLVEIEL